MTSHPDNVPTAPATYLRDTGARQLLQELTVLLLERRPNSRSEAGAVMRDFAAAISAGGATVDNTTQPRPPRHRQHDQAHTVHASVETTRAAVIAALRAIEAELLRLAKTVDVDAGIAEEARLNDLAAKKADQPAAAAAVADDRGGSNGGGGRRGGKEMNMEETLRRGPAANKADDADQTAKVAPRQTLRTYGDWDGDVMGADDLEAGESFASWFLNRLPPTLAERHSVYYGPLQQREVLLKGVTLFRFLLSAVDDDTSAAADTAEGEQQPRHHHHNASTTTAATTMLSDAATALHPLASGLLAAGVTGEALSGLIGEALVVLFLYTVDAKSYHACAVEEALGHLNDVWQRKQLTEDKAYVRPEGVYQKLPDERLKPFAEDRAAYGWNTAIWALVNWAFRVSNDKTQPPEARTKAAALARTLQPFADRLQSALVMPP